jgi:DNA-binding transcriptional regulator YbjK
MASAATAPKKSARPRGAARREALLEAVLRIVAEVGPDAVTHRRVAEVAELPLASTTYWFTSKEHLLTAALELAAERDTARLLEYASAVTARAGDPAADPLDAVVAAIVDSCDDPAQSNRGSLIAAFALLLEAARRPALREIARAWTEAYLVTLGQLLAGAGSRRPRDDAELLLGAADGLLMEQLATGGDDDLRPRLRRLAAVLVASR